MQAYGNLFQGRENVVFSTARHAFKAGFETRINRDTTYFGISPNGEYDFGIGDRVCSWSREQWLKPVIRAKSTAPTISTQGIHFLTRSPVS
jgi:hypothetical protein